MSVLVWIETFAGQALPSSWEALSAGRILANALDCELTALILGENAAAIASEAGSRGADRAIICAAAELNDYRLDPYAALISQQVAKSAPLAVVAVASSRGRELMASAAGDCESGLISDVIDLRVEDSQIIGRRPAYAGKVLMDMSANTATSFVTIRARAFAAPAADSDSAIYIEEAAVPPIPDSIQSEWLDVDSDAGQVNLSEAAIIVSGGRGMANNPAPAPAGSSGEDANIWKAKHGYAHTLAPLAETLGAALGASRAAVDAGYIPYEHQVGQTGKVVSPDLYIACGISGAIQHQAGMRNSKIIVAINKDAEAPIFKLARYGIVGDLYEVAPALTAALRKRLRA